jgi:hypothetical protein
VKKIYKSILLLVFLGLGGGLLAQPGYRVFDFADPSLRSFSANFQLGVSSYFGDLCATGDCWTENKPSIGAGATLRLNDYFFFGFNALYYRIEGSDASSPNLSRKRRNLSFRADNYEFSLVGNFEFLNYNTFRFLTRKEFPLSTFVFLGIGITTNNPAAPYKGDFVPLRPLQTEAVAYSPVAAIIPFGFGVGYRFSESVNANFTIGYRYCFSDYLDDVSSTYAPEGTFTSDLAEELQYRGDEVPFGRKGAIRGNAEINDGYLILGGKIEYKIPDINLNFLGLGRVGSGGMGGPGGGSSQPVRRGAKRRGS